MPITGNRAGTCHRINNKYKTPYNEDNGDLAEAKVAKNIKDQ